jgi:hypothetical protein
MIDKEIQKKRLYAILRIAVMMIGIMIPLIAIILLVTNTPLVTERVIYMTSFSAVIGWVIIGFDAVKNLAE